MDKKNRNNKGFSLIEIVIVIALMAIVTGASMSIYSWIRTQRMEKLTGNISDCLNELRTNEMSKDGVYYLEISKSGDDYVAKIYKSTDALTPGTLYKEKNLGSHGKIKVKTLSQNYTISADNVLKIRYDKSSGALASMTLKQSGATIGLVTEIELEYGNLSKKIVISSITGKHYIENS